jgi:hypothetical protein
MRKRVWNRSDVMCRSGQLSSDRDVDDVSHQLRECMDLERTHVHPMFYDIALEISELKTKRKGADAISAFRHIRSPLTLSIEELETIFEGVAANKRMSPSLQEFLLGRNKEAGDLIKAIGRAMHQYRGEAPCVAFAPVPLRIVFEKLVGFKPHELLFKKTSMVIVQKDQEGDKVRVRVQEPEIHGELYHANCEKDRNLSLAEALRGQEVLDCVIIGVNLSNFSVEVGNRSWMMEMHKAVIQPPPEPSIQGGGSRSRSLIAPQKVKAPADSVVRPRLCSLSWFKNISLNDAKQVSVLNKLNKCGVCVALV